MYPRTVKHGTRLDFKIRLLPKIIYLSVYFQLKLALEQSKNSFRKYSLDAKIKC